MSPKQRLTLSGLFLASIAACTGSGPRADAGLDAAIDDLVTPDVTTNDAVVSDISVDTGPPLPPWPHELPSESESGAPSGFRAARVIVHSHSVHSHDACDGNPYVDGGPNEPCLQSFRSSVCRARIDAVFLTEHGELMGEGPFERVMQHRAGDELVRDGAGNLIAYKVVCADGHRTLVIPGAENELMPIALLRHPTPPAGETLVQTYRGSSEADVASWRAAGGSVIVSHTEQKSIEALRALRPEGIEIYNVHANLDPRIAGPYLGINVGEFLADVTRFSNHTSRLEPDLTFIALFRENTNDLQKWSQLWTDGSNMPSVAASDAHENTFAQLMVDGERGDSYRRVYRWFNNVFYVEDAEITRESLLAALHAARTRVHFEAWGTPVGFSWSADDGTATRVYDGGSVTAGAAGVTLRVTAPTVYRLDASLPAPEIRVRILRSDPSNAVGWVEAAQGAGSAELRVTSAGVYRAEALITPNHARPYLFMRERLVRELPWVYSAPIRVR